ncbi:uncharacterized protein LOC111266015 isoform X2 [Varroa jacobsoni]|uniref:uncharacterized protein LOC111266015 isoform X2 n=1 Tax=Varroa jacobsoni TaxID=62625 RepID=UPI000BF63EDB|nr:uncharacterized protein LOC111266015 isoform X2 [Varroa jacobsoni]
MASPTRPYGVRFVPEMPKNSPMELGLSLAYASSFDGIHTMIQLVCSLCAFVTAVSSRTHIYTLTELTVYVAPKPTPIFVIASMFCLFYVDLLIVAGATLSNFDAESLQSSLFYLMAATSGAIFSTCASVAFFVEAENSIDYALGVQTSHPIESVPKIHPLAVQALGNARHYWPSTWSKKAMEHN